MKQTLLRRDLRQKIFSCRRSRAKTLQPKKTEDCFQTAKTPRFFIIKNPLPVKDRGIYDLIIYRRLT